MAWELYPQRVSGPSRVRTSAADRVGAVLHLQEVHDHLASELTLLIEWHRRCVFRKYVDLPAFKLQLLNESHTHCVFRKYVNLPASFQCLKIVY